VLLNLLGYQMLGPFDLGHDVTFMPAGPIPVPGPLN